MVRHGARAQVGDQVNQMLAVEVDEVSLPWRPIGLVVTILVSAARNCVVAAPGEASAFCAFWAHCAARGAGGCGNFTPIAAAAVDEAHE